MTRTDSHVAKLQKYILIYKPNPSSEKNSKYRKSILTNVKYSTSLLGTTFSFIFYDFVENSRNGNSLIAMLLESLKIFKIMIYMKN